MGELCISCELAGFDHAKNESWKWKSRSVALRRVVDTKVCGENGSIFSADD
jgi:hypothetical protein